MKILSILIFVLLVNPVYADSVDSLLKKYLSQGAQSFDAERGKLFWEKTYSATKNPKSRNCQTCHGKNLSRAGEQVKSGKTIDPMAPSVNKDRYTDIKKIEKWFKRNCKFTLGRVCSPQEKGDLLTYLSQL